MSDFLVRGTLAELDPEVYELTQIESERQARKLILIPSESQAPLAVRGAMGSSFQNIYAEGYPDEDSRWMTEAEILDYPARLADFRRNSDPRYYKGTEYANAVEALARRRCAEAFAANGVTADQIYVNVQALSGGPANNAVYHALVEPGSTVMGMNLLHGGHLSHGSSANRSGKYYKIVHYTVDPETEQIDYEAIMEQAQECKPKMIICGYSSYSWIPNWKTFRRIADSVGAYLLADISHLGGLVASGVVPSPIGYAHVVTSTTHKTLHGPRGAVIMTTDPALAKKLDKAVFPGEQGGPHVHIFAALALTFKLAQTKEFEKLQKQTIKNAQAMSEQFKARGLRVPFGGTNCHMLNVDCRSIKNPAGISLSGDQAARILDLAGIVVNRNTIPGDRSAFDPSGIRLGTPWITQRGFNEEKCRQLADIIADVLLAAVPHSVYTAKGKLQRRAKVDFNVLNDARLKVRDLARSAGIDFEPTSHGYPHFYYIDDPVETKGNSAQAVYQVSGKRMRQFMDYAVSSDLSALTGGTLAGRQSFHSLRRNSVTLAFIDAETCIVSIPREKAALAATWLRDLSDGYISLNLDGKPDYSSRRLPGPVVVKETDAPFDFPAAKSKPAEKPWYIGIAAKDDQKSLPAFDWKDSANPRSAAPVFMMLTNPLARRWCRSPGGKCRSGTPPCWRNISPPARRPASSTSRTWEFIKSKAWTRLPSSTSVCSNSVGSLRPGESLYSHFLTPSADVIDDTLVYRRAEDKFLMVVNASNDDKDRAWLEAVRDGKVCVDNAHPAARACGYNAVIRNLRDPKTGEDMRVDIALQGPKSQEILLAVGVTAATRKQLIALERTQLCDAIVGGFDLIVSRTGYTGEKLAYELFVHPDRVVDLWNALLKAGEKYWPQTGRIGRP